MQKRKNKRGNEARLWVGMAVWLGYVWAKTTAGLAIHPYQSVRRMIVEKEERWGLMSLLSPVIFLGGLLIVGRVGSYVWEVRGWLREVVAGVLGVGLVGLGLWQGLMIVLVIRFWRVKDWQAKKRQKVR